MDSQKELIHGSDWDVLVILDACRYDFFEKHFDNYLCGELSKVRSPASDTPTWLVETFQERCDIKYTSGNPFINSYGMSIKDRIPDHALRDEISRDWYGGEKFTEVIDAWDWAWSETIGVVNSLTIAERYQDSDDKEIIHFVQPHAPYVGLPLHNRSGANDTKDDANDGHSNLWQFLGGNRFTKWLGKNVIDKYLAKTIGWERTLKLQEVIGRELEPLPQTIKIVGADKMPDMYAANLCFGLEATNLLLKKISADRKVVVTSDHGELLGMKRPDRWGHPPFQDDAELRHVPWLEVETDA